MSTCFPCMDGDHQNCGRGNRVDMLECRCDRQTPDCPGQVLQRSGYTFDQAHAYDQAVTAAAPEFEAQLPDVKPMRLRVLELPPRTVVGQGTETPFLLVVDHCPTAMAARLRDVFSEAVVKQSGANTVLVFDGEVELP